MSEKPQPCRHKRHFCLECHGSEFQGGVSVKRTAIEYLKRNHPSACERDGLCETIGGRQYTVTLSCHGYVLAADYESLQADRDQQYDMKVMAREQRDAVTAKLNAIQAECEKLRKDAERYVPLNEAVQRAAAELPEGWEIQMCVMRDSGWVDLIGPDGTEDFDTNNERLDYTVIDALEFAIQVSNP